MVSWSNIQSVLLLVGPILLPKIIQTYRALRTTNFSPKTPPRPLSLRASLALLVLFLSALAAFISTLPLFVPENVFRLTQSRLQTPAGVLMTRLSSIRPLTPRDEKLREVFDKGGMGARLLYAKLGPDAIIDCPFAEVGNLNSPTWFLAYALSGLVLPHLFHLVALGLATSKPLVGAHGAKWRGYAVFAGIVLGAAEMAFISFYDDAPNLRSTRVGEVDFVYWKLRVWVGLGIALVDGVLGLTVYLLATNRMAVGSEVMEAKDKMLDITRLMEAVLSRTRGLGVVRNAVQRDAGLRALGEQYWVKEGEVMKQVFEEPEVMDAQRAALKRLDLVRMGREADGFVDGILNGVMMGQQPQGQGQAQGQAQGHGGSNS